MAAYEVLLLNTAIPQIQAAQAGDTYVVPRDIAVNASLNVTGNTTLGDASTDTVQVNGYMGVGGAASVAYNILARGSTTSGSNQYSIGSTAVLSGTTNSAAFLAGNSIADSVAVTNASGARILNVTLGTSASITSQHGIRIEDLTSGTNNFGITSLVSSGTNKWNIYVSGTAANYFAGNVGIGTTTPEYRLQVSGTTGQTFSIERVASSIGSSTALGTIAGTGEIPTLTADGASIQFLGAGTWSSTSAPGRIVFNTTPAATTTPVERFQLAAGEAVFNDPGNDYDFRVESDTNTHAFFVQGSDGFVGIGTSAPDRLLHLSSADTAYLRLENQDSTGTVGQFIGLIEFEGQDSGGSGVRAQIGAVYEGTNGATAVSIGTSADAGSVTERFRVDRNGNLIQTVNTTAATLTTNQTLTFSIVDDSTLRISVRGSDGTTRTATIALT